jgi:hypothetical protein
MSGNKSIMLPGLCGQMLLIDLLPHPLAGKRELAGCGGGQPGISSDAPLQEQQLSGEWQTVSRSMYSFDESTQQLGGCSDGGGSSSATALTSNVNSITQATAAMMPGVECSSNSNAMHVTMLPLGAWSAVQMNDDGGLIRAEAGMVLQQQTGVVEVNDCDDGKCSSTSSIFRVVSLRQYADDGQTRVAAFVTEQRWA